MPPTVDNIPQNALISSSVQASSYDSASSSANLLSLTHNSQKCVQFPKAEQKEEKKRNRKNGCPNSKYMFVRDGGGKVELCAAPCKSNRCVYCGRKKAWSYVHKVEDLLTADRKAGREYVDLFTTFTLRAGIAPKEHLFRAIKAGHAKAVQAARSGRKGSTRGGGRGIRFPALGLAYANSMDVTEQGTVHIHSLYRLTPDDFRKLPGKSDRAKCKFLARFLWWYYAKGVCKHLGLVRDTYTGSNSPGYVHCDRSSGAVNAAQYMALHNGKAWKQHDLTPDDLPARLPQQEAAQVVRPDLVQHGNAWPYPHRYRLLTTSQGFFPPPEQKEPSDWSFVREGLSFAVARLVEAGVTVQVDKWGRDGQTATLLTADCSYSSDLVGKWVLGGRKLKRWSVALKEPDNEASDEWNNAERMQIMRGERQAERLKEQVALDQAQADSEGMLYWQYMQSELERCWYEAQRLGLTEHEYSAWRHGIDEI